MRCDRERIAVLNRGGRARGYVYVCIITYNVARERERRRRCGLCCNCHRNAYNALFKVREREDMMGQFAASKTLLEAATVRRGVERVAFNLSRKRVDGFVETSSSWMVMDLMDFCSGMRVWVLLLKVDEMCKYLPSKVELVKNSLYISYNCSTPIVNIHYFIGEYPLIL